MSSEDQGSAPDEEEAKGDIRRLRVLRAGDIFGNYRVIRCLCDGLIAGYYHMQHVRDLKDVTIGVFHHRVSNDPHFFDRLGQLKERLESFEHEGIPKIRDCMVIDDLNCIRLDRIEGRTLSDYFAKRGVPGESGLDEESTARILAQILGVLGYAHSQGLDHRDLDSDLIFVADDGAVSVLGLGVKAMIEIDLFESIVSASVSPLASKRRSDRLDSFDVMSPEYQSGKIENSLVDIYCAGVVGYWLLTGQKPVFSRYEPPSSKVPDLPRRWDDYFEKSLERKADDRFPSCRNALEALKKTEDAPSAERSGFIQRQIDRIPVPKQIQARGKAATRVFRLAVIGFVGLTLVALAAFFVHVTFLEERGYARNVAQRVVEGAVPQLRLRLTPPVAKVEFDGYQDSFIVNDGQLELRVRPGDYVLRMSAPNHTTVVVRVSIEREQDYTREMKVQLEPEWAEFEVQSAPEASVAVVDVRGETTYLGITDKTGKLLVTDKVISGTYALRVEREGYEPGLLEGQEIKFGESAVFELPLVPLPASIEIRSSPPGAQISFGGMVIGTTPLTLEGISPTHTHDLLAELDGYRSVEWQLRLRPGAMTRLDLGELESRSGSLEVTAEFAGLTDAQLEQRLSEVEILVGDQRYPYGDPSLNRVPEGEYIVRAIHPLYASKAVALELQDRDVKTLNFELLPRPGFVELTMPGGLDPEVFLDGKPVKLQRNLPIPAKRPVQVELRIQDYLTMSREFTLRPNERATWAVDPVRVPGPVESEDWTLPYRGMRFAWVPAGNFTMGAPMKEEGRLPNEGEQTQVTLTQGFWAGVYEVTQAQYLSITAHNPSAFKGAELPVDSVLWHDAVAFCEALTQIERAAKRLPEGYVYRLPTEAEWEYAARAGSVAPFNFGDGADPSDGNFQGSYPRDRDDLSRATETYGTQPVGSYEPNAFGLYDVHGNVGEWALDSYNGRLPGGSVTDPDPREGGSRATVRGGTWEDLAVRVRASVREDVGKRTQSNAIGFRVVLAPEK